MASCTAIVADDFDFGIGSEPFDGDLTPESFGLCPLSWWVGVHAGAAGIFSGFDLEVPIDAVEGDLGVEAVTLRWVDVDSRTAGLLSGPDLEVRTETFEADFDGEALAASLF
jgi:hypothetical protein